MNEYQSVCFVALMPAYYKCIKFCTTTALTAYFVSHKEEKHFFS